MRVTPRMRVFIFGGSYNRAKNGPSPKKSRQGGGELMSTIFIETVSKAVSDYRQMLRRYLSQSERVSKLSELNLKNPDYSDEMGLYHLARAIIHDIEQNLNITTKNYYSYSGVGNFCRYLKEFLSNYIVEDNTVTHRAQKASRSP